MQWKQICSGFWWFEDTNVGLEGIGVLSYLGWEAKTTRLNELISLVLLVNIFYLFNALSPPPADILEGIHGWLQPPWILITVAAILWLAIIIYPFAIRYMFCIGSYFTGHLLLTIWNSQLYNILAILHLCQVWEISWSNDQYLNK